MKRFLAMILAVSAAFALCACAGNNGGNGVDKEGYVGVLDAGLKLPSEFSEELLEKVVPPGMIEYNKERYKQKDEDYIEELRKTFEQIAAEYAETYGEDWKLSYTLDEAIEKDAEGIENYKSFDGFYFNTYNVDLDKIDAVTFAKVTVHIEGSKGSNDKEKTIQCFSVDGVWYSFYAIRIGVKL